MVSDDYKQGRTRVPDILVSTEPILTGFGSVTTRQETLVTDQGQADHERPPQPKIDTCG